jgi:cytidylate kinase
LHDLPSLRPMRSFAVQEKPSILATFQRVVENQRSYLLYREQDGLPQDMLALTLADLGRVVRRYVVAQEHHFLPHPRRALCHGSLDPTRLLRTGRELRLFGFEEARVGDAARDLALFAVAAQLEEAAEVELLDVYLEARAKTDDRFVHRYFAHKLLCVLERPVTRLLGLYRIKYQGAPVVGDVVDVLNQEMAVIIRELALALTTLNDFLGRGRPLAPRDVASMGRLVAYEDFLLRGRDLVIGIEGAAYTQKTPVATELAARLNASYINVGAWLRTGLRLTGAAPLAVTVEQVAAALADHEILLETVSEPPHYRVLVDGADVTEQLRAADLYQGQRRLLGEARARIALAPLVRNLLHGTTVLEAESLDGLLPEGARRFTLFAAPAVRERRQREHAEALGQPLPPLAPAPLPDGEQALDTSHTPAPQIALEIIQRCLPDDLRAEILVPDFTGRRPLFER